MAGTPQGTTYADRGGYYEDDDEPCGKKKRKNHPGKGWAKGHNKKC